VYSLRSGQAQPAKGPVCVMHFVLVAILAPLAFHSTLTTLSKGRLALLREVS
jgi:hypothetical protein